MDIRRTQERQTDFGSRIWRVPFNALMARVLNVMSPTLVPPEHQQPPTGWDRECRQSDLTLDGHTFLRSDGPTRTLPCPENVELGGCPHVGVFVPICNDVQDARISAMRELALKGHRARMLGEQLWISSISVDATHIYDLSTTVTAPQAEYLRSELFHTNGKEDQPVWRLARQPGCNGVYLPTEPPTLFVYERFYAESISLGTREPIPVDAPQISPYNVLDFVRSMR